MQQAEEGRVENGGRPARRRQGKLGLGNQLANNRNRQQVAGSVGKSSALENQVGKLSHVVASLVCGITDGRQLRFGVGGWVG